MIKKLLSDIEYTITSPTTIVIDPSISFEARNLNLILDTVDNRIVYNFACDDKRATIVGQTITLLDESVLLTDSLTIIMSFDEGSEIEKLQDIVLWNTRIESLLQTFVDQQKITNKYLKKIYNPE
jgi:hypothetical protein